MSQPAWASDPKQLRDMREDLRILLDTTPADELPELAHDLRRDAEVLRAELRLPRVVALRLPIRATLAAAETALRKIRRLAH
jgi:hypothetical protein